jgi:hypothetical protein
MAGSQLTRSSSHDGIRAARSAAGSADYAQSSQVSMKSPGTHTGDEIAKLRSDDRISRHQRAGLATLYDEAR